MRFARDVLETDLYEVLGVPPSATAEHIRRAYRRLVLRTHPDHVREDPELAQRRMAEINVAAGVLLDPVRRRTYDRARRAARRATATPVYGWPQAAVGADDVGEWVAPDAGPGPRRPAHSIAGLRPWPARAAEHLSWLVGGLSPRQHVTLMAVSIVMALGLIAEARPVQLVQLFQPDASGYAPTY